ncbi:hypothetical protein BKA82DRAFT_995665 [Pisolithus tinctorius]|uniref:Uncharacterized protein n=1 Tax=Pisolithus tinctorius Marx 270 TaxID=870435 RepID=A0A0C3KLI9_PISTI|nr:hypothetical protein BKA82DRAFT_995665 [Pisolithus tinctorius]KIO10472.1 hypothetical protein M404DRAFT_995665 [Pisolithus tinctorius Marx 270]
MNHSPARLLVDRCTPRDKFARTHIPLRTSLCPSSDDSVVSPPSSPWTSEFNARRRAHSSSGSPGWRHLPTPIRPTFRPRDYELPPCPEDDDQSDSHTVSLKVLQRSLRNVEFDPSCLDCLDQQLLLSPADSFSEVCYTEAVHEQVPVPVLQPLQPRIRKRTTLYDRTAMSEEDPYHDWDENMSIRWKKLSSRKPLPVPPPTKAQSKNPTPRMSTQDSMLAALESRLLLHNPGDSVHFFPVPSQRRSEDTRKSSLDAPAPSISSAGSSSSTGTLKRLSHALSARSRAKSNV